MNIWDTYQARIDAHGITPREAAYKREVRHVNSKLPRNLSYHQVEIFPREYGYNITSDECMSHKGLQDVAIVSGDSLEEKKLFTMPEKDIELGSLVFWEDTYWLITEKDSDRTVYSKGRMTRCTHLLKWVDNTDNIIEQWCVATDGSNYSSGEYEGSGHVVTRGDSSLLMKIARNKYTVAFDREKRFLIDDNDSPHKLAYALTKPFKTGNVFNGSGTYQFILHETAATDFDNHELGIADYYKHFPLASSEDGASTEPVNGRKVWI